MWDDEGALRDVSQAVVRQMRIRSRDMKTCVALIEHVTRRPQACLVLTARELAAHTGHEESRIRRMLPALFAEAMPWAPCEDEADLLAHPITCPKCRFTCARTLTARADLFGLRYTSGSRRRQYQSYCRWCKNIERMPPTPMEQGLIGRCSWATQQLLVSRGFALDRYGRPDPLLVAHAVKQMEHP